MRNIQSGRYIIEIFDSIDELSSERFQKFNKYLLIDSGVGSDINDFNSHVTRIAQLVKKEPDQAIRELENLRLSMYLISEEINPKHLSFVLLINKINGKPLTDVSDDNIKKVHKQLNSLNSKFIDRLVQTVKKKIDEELTAYFPNRFDDVTVKEYFDNLRQKSLLILGEIIRGEKNEAVIDKIDTYLLELTKPAIFYGKDNAEIKYNKSYEEMCSFLIEKGYKTPKKMTVLEYYSAFDFIQKQLKKK